MDETLRCNLQMENVQGGSNFESVCEILSVIIQMKAEPYFPMALFIMLHKVILQLLSLWIKS